MHAQLAGEKIAGLDGHPSQKIAKIEETNRHTKSGQKACNIAQS